MTTDTTSDTTTLPERLIWRQSDGTTTSGPREEIMRAYAAAGFTGTLVPVAAAPASPAASKPDLRPGVDVDPEAAARIKAAEQFLKARGFAAPPPWFAAGTEMLPEGRAKFGSLARRHEELPLFKDAARAVIDQIEKERRHDVVVGDARAMRLLPDGTLSRGKGSIPLEPNALKGLISRFPKAFPSSWEFLALLSPTDRADVVNAQLSRLHEWYEDDKRNLRLRCRDIDGWRAFAAVSPSYMPMDGDDVLRAYTHAFSSLGLEEPRGAIAYNGETTDVVIRASWHAPQTFRPSVGDVFESGITGRTNDSGNGSHRGGNAFTRIVCINCTTVDFGDTSMRRVHKGSRTQDLTAQGLERIRSDVQTLVAQSGRAAEFFLQQWGVLRDTPIEKVTVGGKRHTDPKTMLKALVSSGDLDADTARDTTVKALLAAYDKEPGQSLADVFNAVTRAAHDGLLDEIERWRLERAAGSLLPVLASRASA